MAKGKVKPEEQDVLDADMELRELRRDTERAKVEKGTEEKKWIVSYGFLEEWLALGLLIPERSSHFRTF